MLPIPRQWKYQMAELANRHQGASTMVKTNWVFRPVIGFSIVLLTAINGAMGADLSVSSRLRLEPLAPVFSQSQPDHQSAAEVFEPRDDNEGQPQDTVG